jgi:phenylpyruvate tautomerase PptA (4-oxalocrotonate tautomerase family)
MPLVTIDLLQGRPSSELDAISESIQEAMVEHLNVLPRDRFQIVTEHSPATLRFDRLLRQSAAQAGCGG